MPDPRVNTSFRIGQAGHDWLETVAKEHATTRAGVLRAALLVARRHTAEVLAVLKQWEDQ